MSVAKVVEVTASSGESFEDAIRRGIKKVADTVDKIEGAWVKEQKVRVEGHDVTEYRVTLKVTFVVN